MKRKLFANADITQRFSVSINYAAAGLKIGLLRTSRLGPATPLSNLSPFTNHFSPFASHPSPLTNNPSPVVPSVDRLSQELTRRVSFTSFSMYEMEIFTCLRRGAYGLCDA
jgi:hypothetical protein